MRNKILGLLIGLICGLFVGCSSSVALAKQNNPIKIWFENNNRNYNVLKVIDEDTNVNYIVVETNTGYGSRSIAICPRYNTDGTLYITNKIEVDIDD